MEDLANTPVLDPTSPPAVWELVTPLRAELGELRDEVARLRKDNLGLANRSATGKPGTRRRSSGRKRRTRNGINSAAKFATSKPTGSATG